MTWLQLFGQKPKPPEPNPYAEELWASIAARKERRIIAQREAKRLYWERQRKRWAKDPLRQ